jgi:hypothetical protein
MPSIPSPLASRLDAVQYAALERLLAATDGALRDVYRANVADYRETRGDDAQLFGLKVWKHLWYALRQTLADDQDIVFVATNGSYEIQIRPLRIGAYGLGHFADEDVHQRFPDSSPFKRAFGEANQLRLFAVETVEPPTDESGYALNSLTLGHFGNARDGLVKWYLGAWTVTDLATKRWAWIERQDGAEEDVEPLPTRPPVVPFGDQPREVLEVRARKPA